MSTCTNKPIRQRNTQRDLTLAFLASANGSPPKMGVNHLRTLNNSRKAIEARARQDIQFAKPLLFLNGIGIIYPNSITVIQGQKGVHKSRLTENFCAAFLGA